MFFSIDMLFTLRPSNCEGHACNFWSLISPLFLPSWDTKHWKNTVFRDCPTCSRICIFSLLSFSSLIFSLLTLSCLIFSLLTLSCLIFFSDFHPGCAFPSVYILESLTSKFLMIILAKLVSITLNASNIYRSLKVAWFPLLSLKLYLR